MDLVRKQVYVTPEMDQAIKRICAAKKLAESEVIRQALEVYFRELGIRSEGDPILRTAGIGASGAGTGSIHHDEAYSHVR